MRSSSRFTVVGPDGNFGRTVRHRRRAAVERRAAPLGPVGTYTVNYRITSADGHPVEGAAIHAHRRRTGTPGASATDESDSGNGSGGCSSSVRSSRIGTGERYRDVTPRRSRHCRRNPADGRSRVLLVVGLRAHDGRRSGRSRGARRGPRSADPAGATASSGCRSWAATLLWVWANAHARHRTFADGDR